MTARFQDDASEPRWDLRDRVLPRQKSDFVIFQYSLPQKDQDINFLPVIGLELLR